MDDADPLPRLPVMMTRLPPAVMSSSFPRMVVGSIAQYVGCSHLSAPTQHRYPRLDRHTCNDNPRPYVWTKTADEILASIANYCNRINDSGH
jgi:hypothetical protein